MTMSNLATTAQARKMGPARPRPMKQRPKPPIKVVYISNPMKVKATASQFRSLVQRLTGRDSELPDDPNGYEDGGNGPVLVEADVVVGGDVSKGIDDDEVVVVSTGHNNDNNNKSSVSTSTSSEGSQPVEATSSCEVGNLAGGGGGARGYYGDEFLMGGGDDGLFPVLGSEAFLWTWMC